MPNSLGFLLRVRRQVPTARSIVMMMWAVWARSPWCGEHGVKIRTVRTVTHTRCSTDGRSN
jgi:hypothetical protein